MRSLILLAHNVRSAHNVGSLMRTAEGLGITKLYLSGYTPYPLQAQDDRLPHIAKKLDSQIAKTALGAEKTLDWQPTDNIARLIAELKDEGYSLAALEQVAGSASLVEYSPPDKLALVVGREVEGLEAEVIKLCDACLEIPMFGTKESFNVAQAAAMALFYLRFSA